jgi:hypoxanthine-guanine phosphoribosyltransferase
MNNDSFNAVVNKGRAFAEYAGNKGKELLEIAKLEFAIIDTKNQINRLYKNLGMQTYTDILEGNMSFTDECLQITKEIDRQKIILAEYKEKLASNKKVKVCPNCGKCNDSENKYCGGCGYSL